MGATQPRRSALKTHAVLAAAQVAILVGICQAADIWRSPRTSEQFPGHLGPALFIGAIGVSALAHDWDWRTRCVVEGRLSLVGGSAYVIGEGLARFLVKGPAGTFEHYMRHGLHAWMCVVVAVVGVAFLSAARLEAATGERLRRAPHVWFASAWCWFIWAHKQPNNFGVAMHAATAAWVALGAYFRCAAPPHAAPREAGCCYVFAAYLFFGGQTGLTLTAAAKAFDPGAYLMVWHALPTLAVLAYVRCFLERSPADGYAPVALEDAEAPGSPGGDVELAGKRGAMLI